MFSHNISLESSGTQREFKSTLLFSWVFDRDASPMSVRQLKINYSKSSNPQKIMPTRTIRYLRIDHSKTMRPTNARKIPTNLNLSLPRATTSQSRAAVVPVNSKRQREAADARDTENSNTYVQMPASYDLSRK